MSTVLKLHLTDCFVFFSHNSWSVRRSHKRRHRRGAGKQFIIFTGPRETESLHTMKGSHGESTQGAGSTK